MADEFFESILAACAPIAELETAFDAELAVSALLGGAYAAADADRAGAVERFAEALVGVLEGREDRLAGALLAALAGVGPAGAGERAARVLPESVRPAWAGQVGAARCTAAWALSDRYQDQTEYVLCFEYPEPAVGGPPHVACVLADRNAGSVKDCWIARSPERVVAACRRSAEADPELVFAEASAEVAGATVRRLLAGTDELAELPESESLAEERCAVLSRLPDPPAPDAAGDDDVVADFLAAPEAAVAGLPADVVAACARLIGEFPRPAGGADRLRFSPIVAEAFLLDWAPRSAVIDEECVRAVPSVLAAFTRYAGRRTGLPEPAVAATVEAIAGYADGFVTAMATVPDRGGRPTAAGLARELIAAGVDPTDGAAVRAWLERRVGAG